jgi:hypothetical protein
MRMNNVLRGYTLIYHCFHVITFWLILILNSTLLILGPTYLIDIILDHMLTKVNIKIVNIVNKGFVSINIVRQRECRGVKLDSSDVQPTIVTRFKAEMSESNYLQWWRINFPNRFCKTSHQTLGSMRVQESFSNDLVDYPHGPPKIHRP